MKFKSTNKEEEFGKLFERQNENTKALFFDEKFTEFLQLHYKCREILVHEKEEENKKTGEKWIKKYLLVKIEKWTVSVLQFVSEIQ